jgi:hypothetical protein
VLQTAVVETSSAAEGGGAVNVAEIEEIDQKDDGYIELVLRVLARMCDGQHRGLQVGNQSDKIDFADN